MPSNIGNLSKISSLKEYLRENKLSIANFSQIVKIEVNILTQYLSGEAFPTREDMEKIFMFTEGKIRPMDFLFLFRYQKDFEIIDYIEYYINLNVVCKKEIAYELGISVSGLCRRLQGEYAFQKDEITKIITLIENKKEKK